MRTQGEMLLLYCITAITRPKRIFLATTTDQDKLGISLGILLLFGTLYSITSMLLYLTGRRPVLDPWMSISKEYYYFYQTFWTIPWGLATAILMTGIAYIMANVGREGNKCISFESALLVITVSWVVPSFVLMWIPETFIAPWVVGNALPWPVWIDVLRLSILAPGWQMTLTTIGIQTVSKQQTVVRALLIGIVTTIVSFLMFLPFMR